MLGPKMLLKAYKGEQREREGEREREENTGTVKAPQ